MFRCVFWSLYAWFLIGIFLIGKGAGFSVRDTGKPSMRKAWIGLLPWQFVFFRAAERFLLRPGSEADFFILVFLWVLVFTDLLFYRIPNSILLLFLAGMLFLAGSAGVKAAFAAAVKEKILVFLLLLLTALSARQAIGGGDMKFLLLMLFFRPREEFVLSLLLALGLMWPWALRGLWGRRRERDTVQRLPLLPFWLPGWLWADNLLRLIYLQK